MSNIPGPIALAWIVCRETAITPQQPSIHFNNLVYAQINVSPAYGPPMNTWTVADAKPWNVPGDAHPDGPAKALDLAGIIGATHGNTQEVGDLRVAFRRLGDASAIGPVDFGYAMQSDCALIGEGTREDVDVTVALVDGMFEWCWWVSTPTGVLWPTNSSYLINIGPVKWHR